MPPADRRGRAAAASRPRRPGPARAPVVAVVAAALVAGLVLGRAGRPARPAAAQAPRAAAAPASALSSTWYCAGASARAGGVTPGSLVLSNTGRTPLRAAITLFPDRGPVRHLGATVAADSRETFVETAPHGPSAVGASVTLDGGGASVEQQVSGPLGITATPCATTGSARWYFATGATRVNAHDEIELLNPYPSTAIVDLTFTTNEGLEQPQAFQAMVVRGDSLTAVDLGSQLRRRTSIATTVTASTGRVVAWQAETVTPPRHGEVVLGTKAADRPDADPASPFPGVSVTPGAPALSSMWLWPQGETQRGVEERYLVYNPGRRTARVKLSVHLATGTAEPFTVTVGPGQVSALTTASETRIPPGVGYSVSLRSTDGIPVVAERTVAAGPPARVRGTAQLVGATAPARSWLVGAGAVDARLDELLAVSNPGRRPVVVTVDRLDPSGPAALPGLASVHIGAQGSVDVNLSRVAAWLASPLVVRATGPVVVGRELDGRGRSRGLGLSLGVPLTPAGGP
ncbi:MAG TPA: DUF5719 family protein [Acidimicrobiales bacterium]|nr:DUF5719 family protein [Acidimicrobiales bacterium]